MKEWAGDTEYIEEAFVTDVVEAMDGLHYKWGLHWNGGSYVYVWSYVAF
jgi:hypothetical protein